MLEKLATYGETSLFVAEQPGAQRLVLLEVRPSDSVLSESAESYPTKHKAQHPHVVDTILVQLTPKFRLVAYEFFEAQTLGDVLMIGTPEPSHRADLVRQWSKLLSSLDDEAIGSLAPEAALIDRQGQLKWLAGPNPLVSKGPVDCASASQRNANQIAAIQRLAVHLGGVPEIADCTEVAQVIDRLSEWAEPWGKPFSTKSLRCPRSVMNRLLRKGPALRLIQAFGPEQQLVLEGLGETISEFRIDAETTVPSCETPAPVVASADHSPPRSPQSHQPHHWTQTQLIVGVLVAISIAVFISQWVTGRGAKRAAATSERLNPASLQPGNESSPPVTTKP